MSGVSDLFAVVSAMAALFAGRAALANHRARRRLAAAVTDRTNGRRSNTRDAHGHDNRSSGLGGGGIGGGGLGRNHHAARSPGHDIDGIRASDCEAGGTRHDDQGPPGSGGNLGRATTNSLDRANGGARAHDHPAGRGSRGRSHDLGGDDFRFGGGHDGSNRGPSAPGGLDGVGHGFRNIEGGGVGGDMPARLGEDDPDGGGGSTASWLDAAAAAGGRSIRDDSANGPAGPLPTEFAGGWRSPAGVAGLVLGVCTVALVAGIGLVLAGLTVAGVAAVGHRARERTAERNRRRAQLPVALDRLASALHGGASVATALTIAGDTVPPPLGAELSALGREADGDRPVAEVLDEWADTRNDPGTRLAATALVLAGTIGASPARAAHGVAATLRERAYLADERRSLASQARLSGLVLSVAPIGFTLLVGTTDPATRQFLLDTPPGWACLTLGLALDAAGAWWMSVLTRGGER
jgi:tight adherence protein B